MRLRLFSQLFLLLAGSAVLGAMAMAIVLSFNLRSGFSYYLQAQDREQLDEFVLAAATNIAARGVSAFQRDGSLDINALITDMVRRGDVPNASSRSGRSDVGTGHDPVPVSLLPPDRRPKRSGRPPGGFALRLLMYDAAGNQVIGPPPLLQPGSGASQMLECPIKAGGKIVAVAKLLPRGRTPNNVDAKFLQSQYRSAGLTVIVSLTLAVFPALLIARYGARRLAEMQKAANEIAQGNLTARVAVRGDDELSAMGRDINSMAESLTNLDSSRRRWLAEISHELRTPLSVLIGELDALKDEVRPLNMGAVQSLSDEAERMGRIVNDLHALAMSDLSGTFCKFTPCDAITIITRAHARFTSSFEAAAIALNVADSRMSALPVVWDEPRVGQILANILTNSLRYTNAPGRTVITLGAIGTDVLIQIDDSAPAVLDEHVDRLFEPLYRAEAARDRATGGSGLGLAVSEAIVKAHNGNISISKSDLGGLCVKVILPRNPSQA